MGMNSQKGFTLVEALLLILVVAIVGFGAYFVGKGQDEKNMENTTSTKSSKDSEKRPTEKIKQLSNKEQIAKLVDETCPGEGLTIVNDSERTVINGSFARVSVGCEEGGGFAGYLQKKSGTWSYLVKTQDTPSCADFDNLGVPASIVDECYDEATSGLRAPKQ